MANPHDESVEVVHDLTVIGQFLDTDQITADVYEIPGGNETDAIRQAISEEEKNREEEGTWEAFCVIRGDVQMCWAKDE